MKTNACNKFLALLLSLSMVFVSVFSVVAVAADATTATVGSATAKAGETVTLTLDFANNPGVAGMFYEVVYNSSVLTLKEIVDKEVIGGATHNVDENVLYWSNAKNQTASGIIAELVFEVAAGAAAGDYEVTLTYDPDNMDIINAAWDNVDVAVVAGKVTVEADAPVVTGPTTTVSSASAKAGETVTLTLDFANNPGVAGMFYEVEYNSSVLTLKEIVDKEVIGGATHNVDENVLYWSNAKNQTASGIIAELVFEVAAGAAAGDYEVTLTYDPDNMDIINAAWENVDVAIVAGKVTVEAGAQPPVVNKYTVIYKVNGEVVDTFENVEEGAAVPASTYVVPEGYDFSGFGNIPATVTGDLTFEGTATIKTFTVIYKVDGEVVDTFEDVEYGAAVPASTYVVPEGYTFTGFGNIPATVTEDLTFEGTTEEIPAPPVVAGPTTTVSSATAKAGETVTLTLDFANNPGVAGMFYEVVYNSSVLTLKEIVDKEVIGGATHNVDENVLYWSNAKNQTASGIIAELVFEVAAGAAAGDYEVTLTYDPDNMDIINAAWENVDVAIVAGKVTVEAGAQPPVVNKYTVIYKVDGEVVATFTDVEEGSETPVYEYTAPEGYTFSGWGEIPATVTEDLVIEGTTEEIVIPTFTVTFQVGELVVGTITKDEGESVEKTEYPAVEPKEGHTIVWDNEGPITEDATVYGTYVANSYTVTYKVDGEVVHTETVVYGAEIPAYEYEVADGYTFSGWDANVPATMPAEDLVFEGTTEEIPATMYTVTFIVNGEEYDVIEVEEGTAIGDLMPADPEVATYIFNGWFEATGAPVDAETIINGDIEVTADFSKDAKDVNGDDVIDSKDSIYLLNHCALPELYPIDETLDFDFNEDGVVSSKDAVAHFLALALSMIYSIG